MTPSQVQTVLTKIRVLWPRCPWNDEQEQAFGEGILKVHIDAEQAVAALNELFRTGGRPFPESKRIMDALTALVQRPQYNHVRGQRNLTVDVYRARQEKKGHGGKTDEQVIVFQCRHSGWSLEQQFEHCVQCFMELPTYQNSLEAALRRALDAYPGQQEQAQAWMDRASKPFNFRREKPARASA